MEDPEEIHDVNVCVAVRCRPMSGKELAGGHSVTVEFPGDAQVALTAKRERYQFAFDHIFSPETAQENVYQALGVPLLDKAFEGFNSTIFAYGQTGSGKTHTMMAHRAGPDERGLIPRISDGLYDRINSIQEESENRRFLVCCSFLEIYNEIIYDLLVPRSKTGKGLEIREAKGVGVYVKDLTEMVVDSSSRLNSLIENGFEHRSTAATKMNDASSRSHCIFIIKIHQKDSTDDSKNTFSKLNLVDLAGSERAKSTEAEGDRLKEGANINKSLSALGNVINALSSMASGNRKVFVPYRNSKLTRVLQESLGGNSLCTMVATISPSESNAEETLSTLNYAKRAKTIKVNAVKNDEASQVRKLEEEVEALRRKLAMQAESASGGMSSGERMELETKYETQINELQSFMKQSWEEKQRISEEHAYEQARIMEEAARLAARAKEERRLRLELLEKNGDIQLTLQNISAFGGGSYSWPWMDRISDMIKAEQGLKAQLRAVRLYRDSAGADFSMCIGCQVSDAVAILTLMNQIQNKLGMMKKELEKLAQLEVQLDEQVGHISPGVALALRDTQEGTGGGGTGACEDDEEEAREELSAMISLVQQQLAQKHAATRSFVFSERMALGFPEELRWLRQCLEKDGASGDRTVLLRSLEIELQAMSEIASGSCDDAVGSAAASALESSMPMVLGLSTLEFPDDQILGSSNVFAARCGRLLQALAFGGWCPAADADSQYFEVRLGGVRRITAISIQGRMPCSSDCVQTRELLQMVLEDVPLPPAEKFRRPPVRLLHDVGVALAQEKNCFGAAGGEPWDIPVDLLNYGDLSREQKVEFFAELIHRTNEAMAQASENGHSSLTLSPQDILSGKNCEESNRLLQLLSYITLASMHPRSGGLMDVAPQWMTAWTLSYFGGPSGGDDMPPPPGALSFGGAPSSGETWKWYGAPEGGSRAKARIFEGNADPTTVKYVPLPEPVMASRIRIHPSMWKVHPAGRFEVYCTPVDADLSRVSSDGGSARRDSLKKIKLENSVDLCVQAILEVKRGLQERQQKRQKEEEAKAAEVTDLKDKAEFERDRLAAQLREALARVEELEAARCNTEGRAGEAESGLLAMRVENERLQAQVEQTEDSLREEHDHRVSSEEQAAAMKAENAKLKETVEDFSNQVQIITEERDFARSKEEELFELIAMKDEDLMDTNNGYVYLTEQLQEREEEMERLEVSLQKHQESNERLDERAKQLQDEVFELRAEMQRLKTKLAEEERMCKAAQDRYSRLLKDSAATAPAAGDFRLPPKSPRYVTNPSRPPTNGYDDDFE